MNDRDVMEYDVLIVGGGLLVSLLQSKLNNLPKVRKKIFQFALLKKVLKLDLIFYQALSLIQSP